MNAQVQSQIFIYILVIVVVGLLLLLGYKAIGNLRNDACKVNEVSLKAELETAVQDNSAYKASDVRTFQAGCAGSVLCFADAALVEGTGGVDFPLQLGRPATYFFYVNDSMNAHVLRNVFILDNEGTMNERAIFIPRVEVEQNLTCIEAVQGLFKVRFEGTGKGTKVFPG
ncbi:MAG: hypothetical protein V1725_06220 [archaeon]